eukprot:TRINITY_DN14542_c0_g1_i1.p1 TRINITY_DN14542_c0_g1~~TRINITY_DN14542_c0_g1_i1.p1  ORF type:complete len:280 (-),score=56.19 TRINITY_DN14542_c0_g1_i1:201-980(-)
MQLAKLAAALLVSPVAARLVGRQSEQSCQTEDAAYRALLGAKLSMLGEDCEKMCRDTGAYPKCKCPAKEETASNAALPCIAKYCQDTFCPNSQFRSCVESSAKLSTLQWGSLFETADALLGNVSDAGVGPRRRSMAAIQKHAASAMTASCLDQDRAHRALLQARLQAFGVSCEDMCRELGAYPNCQCPGFQGQPSSDGDNRACMDKYCQDLENPCPNDNFVNCVKENTKVSVLQWGELLAHMDIGQYVYKRTLAKMWSN